MTQKKHSPSFYILYLLFLVFGFVILAEIMLRLFWTPPAFQFVVKGNDPIYHHSNREDHELATFDTWRRPILKRISNNELRVFLVGDSFAMGMVDSGNESVSAFIEKQLDKLAPDKTATVYNMAMISYSPLINYLVVKNLILPNDPDVVVMMLDASDLADDSLYGRLAIFNDNGNPVAVPPPPQYELLPLKLEMAFIVLKTLAKNHWQWRTYVQERENRLAHYRDSADKWKDAFAQTNKYIAMTADLCKQKGIPFLLVMHPNLVVLSDKSEFGDWLNQWGFDKDKTYSDKNFSKALSLAAKKQGYPFLDLEPFIVKNEPLWKEKGLKNSQIYKVEDGHFTPLGHSLIAMPIADFIIRNLPKNAGATN